MRSVDPQTAFREAVLEVADEATPVSVRRYLAASRLLEGAAARAPAKPRPRPVSREARR
jgi:hypothetical protein